MTIVDPHKPTETPPAISVIIPAFNEEGYLADCLSSAIARFANGAAEIIVVDNNSTDSTREIIEAFPQVTYVFEPRKGITRARQRGFDAARGEILAFIDADTRPPSGWIEQIRWYFDCHEDLACLSGPYSFYDLTGLRRRLATGWFTLAQPIYWMTGYLIVGGNFAIRRDVLERMGGFDTSIEFYGEDVDIAKRAKQYGRVLFSKTFVMPTSARRMQRHGFAKMAFIYFANFVSIAIRGRPASKTYEDIR